MKKLNMKVLVISIFVLIIVSGLFLVDTFNSLTIKTDKVKVITNTIQEEKPSYTYLKSITVYIEGESSEEKIDSKGEKQIEIKNWIGTGTIIKIEDNTTYILTNAHVAGRYRNNVALFIEDKLQLIEAEVVAYNEKDSIDLAIIKVDRKLKNKREIKGIGTVLPSDPIYLVGHHLGRKYIYGEGVFAGHQGIYNILQIPTAFGNSGTGVCNSKGELVSVVFAINRIGFFSYDVAHGLAIDSISIKIFLQSLGLYEQI